MCMLYAYVLIRQPLQSARKIANWGADSGTDMFCEKRTVLDIIGSATPRWIKANWGEKLLVYLCVSQYGSMTKYDQSWCNTIVMQKLVMVKYGSPFVLYPMISHDIPWYSIEMSHFLGIWWNLLPQVTSITQLATTRSLRDVGSASTRFTMHHHADGPWGPRGAPGGPQGPWQGSVISVMHNVTKCSFHSGPRIRQDRMLGPQSQISRDWVDSVVKRCWLRHL